MALPTPVKSYIVSPNNLMVTVQPNQQPWADRIRDIAKWLSIATTQLLAIAPGYSHVGSCDSTTLSPIGGSGLNLWDPGIGNIASFGDFLYRWYNYLSGPPMAPWIVMGLPGGAQICIGFERDSPTGNHFRVLYSASGAFANPVSGYYLPQAADQRVICDSVFGYSQVGVFNEDGQGITNSNANRSSYNQQIQVMAATDGSGFAMFSFVDNAMGFGLFFSTGLEQPVSATWSGVAPNDLPIMLATVYPTVRRIVYYNAIGIAPTTPGVSWALGGTVLGACNTGGDLSFTRPVTWNVLPDSDVSAFGVYPIPIYGYSSTGNQTGLKGVLRDIWWGQALGSCTLYPVSGPPQFVQLGDIIVPWQSATLPLFAG